MQCLEAVVVRQVAVNCAVLAPMIYTWHRSHEKRTLQESKIAQEGAAGLLQGLEERVRLLDRDGADHIMQLGFTKVQEDIIKQKQVPIRVEVSPQHGHARKTGYATREQNSATYLVTYDDSTTEAGVTVERLEPTEEQPHVETAQRCEGWLQTSYLAAANEDEMPVAIQRRAVLIDSCRSFLTLELPSLCGACG